MTEADAMAAFGIAFGPLDAVVPTEELGVRALELAIALDHPIYDCFYLALAERERAPVVTADRALLRAAKRAKDVAIRAL